MFLIIQFCSASLINILDIFITILYGFEKRTGTNYRLLTKAFKREGWKILKWEKCNEKYFNLVGEIESKNNKVSNMVEFIYLPIPFQVLFSLFLQLYNPLFFFRGWEGKNRSSKNDCRWKWVIFSLHGKWW